MQENRLSLRDLLSITLPFCSSSFFLHNTDSLPLTSSSSDAAEQTCVVDSGSHPKRTREGSAAAFPVVEFCNSVRKKKKQRLGSELLQISREPWSIVDRLQLWNTSTSTSSVADLQRDHRTIDCLALTDVCRHAVVKCSSVVEAAAAEGSKQLFLSSGNTNEFQKYLGKGKIVHGPSCSGEDYKSSLSAGGCLEIHSLKLLAGSSAVSLQLPTFPSLSLSPTAADIGKIVCESPELKK
ncbi:unnamed protein product [Sphagnum compactum]